ncbi:putative protein SHORT ROOT IN SALT MEDIUM 1 [Cocos nucifera]|nr:putative protein SHORT ROOT IN SALT MEDIUM 1 [Cocos nucifera]
MWQDGMADGTADLEAGSEKTRGEGNGKKSANEKSGDDLGKVDEKSAKQKEQKHPETPVSESVKEEVVDKELLLAFRFFDQNSVGYIKVEDLRCIIHNMGKFLSNRDVKELVQSALFESNSARDNRIFYRKLVRLTDL